MDVPHHGASDEDVLDRALQGCFKSVLQAHTQRPREGGVITHQMGVLELIDNLDVVELDIEVLVDALEDALELNVVLEFDRDLVVDEGLEEATTPRQLKFPYCSKAPGDQGNGGFVQRRLAYLKKSIVLVVQVGEMQGRE